MGRMAEKIATAFIKHNTIYIPQNFLNTLKIRNNDEVVLRCNKNGLLICRKGFFVELDEFFNSVDKVLK